MKKTSWFLMGWLVVTPFAYLALQVVLGLCREMWGISPKAPNLVMLFLEYGCIVTYLGYSAVLFEKLQDKK